MFDPDQGLPDPFVIDRAVASTARRARRFRRALRAGGGLDDDPYEADRWISQRRTFRALGESSETDPLREPMQRWCYKLLEERVNRALVVRAVARYRHATVSFGGPATEPMTASAVLHSALSDSPRRTAWLDVFGRHAENLGPLTRRLWERRGEIPERLGLGSADALELPISDIEARALEWLRATDDAFEQSRSENLADFVTRALGADSEGWPGQIHSTTLSDWFRDTQLFDRLDLDPGPWPAPFGSSSHSRALRRLGAAWVDATAPARQPFVVANDPYGLRRRTMGALLATLPVTAPFARRALGLASIRLRDHQRVQTRVLLVESRVAALRVLLGRAARTGGAALSTTFQERSEHALGFALGEHYAGVLPRLQVDDPQRFAGMLLAAEQHFNLVERHDEDWYRNPRTAEELRDSADLSPEPRASAAAMDAGAAALLRLVSAS
jgi:hypothetical protein